MPNNSGGEPPFAFLEPEWLDETDSTNDEIRRRLAARPGLPPGTVLAARLQTSGKGRMGRSGHSSMNAGLTFSFLWGGDVPLEQASTLPMACCLGVRDFLSSRGVDSRCKWPNDILVNDAKICGILAESMPAEGPGIRLIVGLGMNLADDPRRDRLVDQPVAALSRCTGTRCSPESLLPPVLEALASRIRQWTLAGFPGIRDEMRSCLWGVGTEAKVRTGANGETTVKGRIDGLGDRGELILIGRDGKTVPVISASALDF